MDIARRPRARQELPSRRLPGQVPLSDALLVLGLLVAFSEPGFDPYHHDGGTVWAAVGVLSAVTLAWRRAAPRPVWLATTIAAGWLLATRHGVDWGGLSPLILILAALSGLCNLASRTSRRAGQLAATLTLTALEAGLLAHPVRPEAVATVGALTVAAWAAGESASARTHARVAERGARDVLAAVAERARIARELHDILAHHVSVISLQAGAARLLAQAGTPPDADLLAGIETASRQAMTELRHALGVIRHAPDGPAPPPGLARLPELAAATGLSVTLAGTAVQDGAPAAPLPAAVELTAYRVVQESLTNVLRHSAARAARVTLRRADGVLRITVTDDGPALPLPAASVPAGQPGGDGLRGLRERATAHGGTFRAGPPGGGASPGFEVSVTLPVPGEPVPGEPGPAGAA
jgi:signal transduction histidine kinase